MSKTTQPKWGDCPFKILGVSMFATKDEVDKAWRRKMREVHPDKTDDNGERAKIFNDAHDKILANLHYTAFDHDEWYSNFKKEMQERRAREARAKAEKEAAKAQKEADYAKARREAEEAATKAAKERVEAANKAAKERLEAAAKAAEERLEAAAKAAEERLKAAAKAADERVEREVKAKEAANERSRKRAKEEELLRKQKKREARAEKARAERESKEKEIADELARKQAKEEATKTQKRREPKTTETAKKRKAAEAEESDDSVTDTRGSGKRWTVQATLDETMGEFVSALLNRDEVDKGSEGDISSTVVYQMYGDYVEGLGMSSRANSPSMLMRRLKHIDGTRIIRTAKRNKWIIEDVSAAKAWLIKLGVYVPAARLPVV